ncbi:hypothetical protein FF100_04985 [Methylobacterium terricola]|uniref:Uncharacterized protein n=1 Tax=Methylobacterium terricola TaxID=2583531 RepID=A0A5C4LLK6_9HYPH|nr:hypothetical protein [Methylobacterium terricola]TNC14933.1 hypothetical protein FF100_04985 [Methylobacterium terricola]
MSDIITVTIPELPAAARVDGSEMIAVFKGDRLQRIEQSAIRGTKTFSGTTPPPDQPSSIMALQPVLGDRWRNTDTGDEWKVTNLDPFTWTFDGNLMGAPSQVPGPAGAPGAAGKDGKDGQRGLPGPGLTVTKIAASPVAGWSAIVASGPDGCRASDPSDPAQRQQVIGVTAYGGLAGSQVTAQISGDLLGPNAGFVPGTTLFVGAGGVLTSTPPTSGWRQAVASVIADGHIVVNLGEATLITAEDALIAEGGFATAATALDVASGQATGKYVTPPALASAPFQPDAAYALPARTKSLRQWFVDLATEGADLRMLGFVGDGASHPLSQRFSTLAAARAVFPRANALSEEIDGHAIQRVIDLAVAADASDSTPGGACVVLPRGTVALTSFPIDSTATASCSVFSPGPATIKCVGSAAGAWTHGKQGATASGPLTWSGVDLDSSSTGTTTGLTAWFGSAGAGRGLTLTIEKSRFNRMDRGALIADYPRGVKVDNVVVFGKDNVTSPLPGIEVIATATAGYGPASAKFTNCLIANYTWGWKFTDNAGLEGSVFENCRSYNGWGLCQVRVLRQNYRSVLWTFQNCDWQGKGFALDMYNVRKLEVTNGYWAMDPNSDNLPLPSDTVTSSGERRIFNLNNVQGFDIVNAEVVVSGPNQDVSPGALETNFVIGHVDANCFLGRFDGTIITCDHAVATALFRLSGQKKATIAVRGTRINYVWSNPPVVVYTGTGDQPYQISADDVAAKSGSVSDAGYYRFSGVTVVTTGSDGKATIPLPKRAPGILPFFTGFPTVTATSENSNGPAIPVTVTARSSTDFTVIAANSASGATIAVNWNAEGF